MVRAQPRPQGLSQIRMRRQNQECFHEAEFLIWSGQADARLDPLARFVSRPVPFILHSAIPTVLPDATLIFPAAITGVR
jgi:hypothetical protein